MKKRIIGILLFVLLINIFLVSAEICNPKVTLLNQDPYPATPGEYVKLVFQISNVSNPDCKNIKFELTEKYPLMFDPGFNPIYTFESGFYQRDFNSYVLASYKVRIDESAIEGDNPIETILVNGGSTLTYEYDLYVEDSRADFEVHIDKYSYESREMTLEILNIADTDVEALSIEIPKQENIEVRGSNKDVVGDLDSNEFTTADFVAIPKDGDIQINIYYTDQEGTRRTVLKNIRYDSSYFILKDGEKPNNNILYLVIGLLIIIIVVVLIFRRRKKNNGIKHRRAGKISF